MNFENVEDSGLYTGEEKWNNDTWSMFLMRERYNTLKIQKHKILHDMSPLKSEHCLDIITSSNK